MAIPSLPDDFKEFLKLLGSNGIEYLPIGGYAVNVYGYVRTTNDLDVWANANPENAARIDRALREFGFTTEALTLDLFLARNNVIRMGLPPVRIEILTSVSGVEFDVCYAEKEMIQIEEMAVPVISLVRLRQNKAASARAKDIADLENLPE
jgi:hypothetical protein